MRLQMKSSIRQNGGRLFTMEKNTLAVLEQLKVSAKKTGGK